MQKRLDTDTEVNLALKHNIKLVYKCTISDHNHFVILMVPTHFQYITDKQKEQIILYYFNNNTLAQIGKKFSISREAVRQNIKRAFESIRKYDQSTN